MGWLSRISLGTLAEYWKIAVSVVFILMLATVYYITSSAEVFPAYMNRKNTISRPYSSRNTLSHCSDPDAHRHLLHYRYDNISQILYNRVPKCGSSTTNELLKILADRNGFYMIKSRIFTKLFVSEAEQISVVRRFRHWGEPMIYSRHLYYINFTHYGSKSPGYINVIRDPVQRFVSAYYYMRIPRREKVPEEMQHMKLDVCVKKELPECTDVNSLFQIIPYFCGQHEFCRYPNEAALKRAMRNVEEHYAVVGILEDLTNFYRAAEYLMPKLLQNLEKLYKDGAVGKMNKNSEKVRPKPYTLKKLRDNMSMEYEFYYYIKQRFYNLLYAIEKYGK